MRGWKTPIVIGLLDAAQVDVDIDLEQSADRNDHLGDFFES
jgi:hypothetical protein